jgi:hypothetical protein
MCLTYNQNNYIETQKIKSEPKTAVACYKIYDIAWVNQNKFELKSVVRGSRYSIPGVIMSDAVDSYDYPTMRGYVYNGIHVYTTKQQAQSLVEKELKEVVVKVKCWNKDLIMLGLNNEAVYDRVEVEYDEYRRLLKTLLRRKK